MMRWWGLASVWLTWGLMGMFAFLLSGNPIGPPHANLIVFLYCLTLVAPLMFLFLAIVSSFSSERDEPGFQRCTTLPVPWALALSSKLLALLLGAVVSWLPALILADAIVNLYSKPDTVVLLAKESTLAPLFETYFPMVFCVAFAICSISLVCIQLGRNSATGISLAFCLTAPALICWVVGFGFLTQSDQMPTFRIWAFVLPLLTGVGFLMRAAGLYRWRWYRGMYSNVLPINLWPGSILPVSSNSIVWPMSWRAPRPLLALLWLAWRKNRLVWGIPLAGVLVYVGDIGQYTPGSLMVLLSPIGYLILSLLIALGAIWSFHGERAGEPECFLAERGISPTRIWWSRYLANCVGGSVFLFGVLYLMGVVDSIDRSDSFARFSNQQSFEFALLLFVGIHVFSVACQLAGQTFCTWQVAVFAIGAGFLLSAMLFAGVIHNHGYGPAVVYLGLVLCVLPLSWWLCRYASIRWQPNLDWVCPVLTVVVFLTILMTS